MCSCLHCFQWKFCYPYFWSSVNNMLYFSICFKIFSLHHWFSVIWLWCALVFYSCPLRFGFTVLLGSVVYSCHSMWKTFGYFFPPLLMDSNYVNIQLFKQFINTLHFLKLFFLPVFQVVSFFYNIGFTNIFFFCNIYSTTNPIILYFSSYTQLVSFLEVQFGSFHIFHVSNFLNTGNTVIISVLASCTNSGTCVTSELALIIFLIIRHVSLFLCRLDNLWLDLPQLLLNIFVLYKNFWGLSWDAVKWLRNSLILLGYNWCFFSLVQRTVQSRTN